MAVIFIPFRHNFPLSSCLFLFSFFFFCSLVVYEVYLTLQKPCKFGILIVPILQVKKQRKRTQVPKFVCVRAALGAGDRRENQSGSRSWELRHCWIWGLSLLPQEQSPSLHLSAQLSSLLVSFSSGNSPYASKASCQRLQAYVSPTVGNLRENTETVFPLASTLIPEKYSDWPAWPCAHPL